MRSILLLSLLWLSACGWQLQGNHQLPAELAPVFLALDDPQSALAQELRNALRDNGVEVADSRAQAASVLEVLADENGHTVTSVSALNEPQQYEVYYRVEYVFTAAADARTLIPRQGARVQRTMSYDKQIALAKMREEQALSASLARELAQQILRRLTLLRAAPATP